MKAVYQVARGHLKHFLNWKMSGFAVFADLVTLISPDPVIILVFYSYLLTYHGQRTLHSQRQQLMLQVSQVISCLFLLEYFQYGEDKRKTRLK